MGRLNLDDVLFQVGSDIPEILEEDWWTPRKTRTSNSCQRVLLEISSSDSSNGGMVSISNSMSKIRNSGQFSAIIHRFDREINVWLGLWERLGSNPKLGQLSGRQIWAIYFRNAARTPGWTFSFFVAQARRSAEVEHCYHIRKQILRISKLPTVTSIFSLLDNFSSISTAAPSLIQPRKIHLQVEDHQRGRLTWWHNVNFDTSPRPHVKISFIIIAASLSDERWPTMTATASHRGPGCVFLDG